MAEKLNRLGMYRLIADKIERDPQQLEIGLANIARWMANGSDQRHKLEEWRARILAAQKSEKGMSLLLDLLREDSEHAEFERNFAPFAGVLTSGEVNAFFDECAYAH